MNTSDAISTIERFFLDILGGVMPGVFLLYGMHALFNHSNYDFPASNAPGLLTFLILGVCYAIGHILTWMGDRAIEPAYRGVTNKLIDLLRYRKKIKPRKIKSPKQLIVNLVNTPIYEELKHQLNQRKIVSNNFELDKTNDIRNLALSIPGADKTLTHRFTFLSLFCLTSASSVVLLLVTWVAAHLVKVSPAIDWQAFSKLNTAQLMPFNWIILITGLIFICGLMNRYYRFFAISFRIPISDAIVQIHQFKPATTQQPSRNSKSGPPNVYLAGGFHGEWHDKVINKIGTDARYLNPATHDIKSPSNYSKWDLSAIEAANIIFAYFGADNPGGYSLALEVGYAKSKGIFIIFVDEKSTTLGEGAKYLDMLHQCADYSCISLEEGIDLLDKHLKLERCK